MKVDEIRERFLRFFEQRGHRIYPSDSLVPASDPTLLFTSAGMNQFKEEFLGVVKGPRRAATCQKCLRTGDLENVGRTPGHHTFFEMLGNFSFGDYFKKDAIKWAWEFLTEDLGLKESELWVSVYRDDEEAYSIWREDIKIPVEKILRFGEKENFWPSNAPSMGPNGPCGPCSEIFYGGPDGVEVWNLVFTQFDRKESGELDPLPHKNIDTGMGLERIARVLQSKDTNFEIDSFVPLVNGIEGLLKTARDNVENIDRTKVYAIADHIRAVTFAISDGVLPSNEERGYVIRKLIRRAFWYGRSLGLEGPFLYKLVPLVAKVMKVPYPELIPQREDISQVILAEEKRFKNTIREGLERLSEMLKKSRARGVISGEDIFKLYDTYGFPLELTREIVRAENIEVDINGFEVEMEKQRTKSRDKSKIKDSIFVKKEDFKFKLPETPFVEDKDEIKTSVIQIVVGEELRETIAQNEMGSVFLKQTNFYGEKGGQVGDTGVLIKGDVAVAQVMDTIDIAGRVEHKIKMVTGTLKKGDNVIGKIDRSRREKIRRNHTATHLLHAALRRILGPHVKQAGSLVAPDHLRFDFTHFKALTDLEIARVEELVNEYIEKDSPVNIKMLPLADARHQGAIALFGEKYADMVRMVAVEEYSKELCGGTHVVRTGEINMFKIVSESSIASGIRRIEAVTAEDAEKILKADRMLIEQISRELGVSTDGVFGEIENKIHRVKRLEKKLKRLADAVIRENVDKLLKNKKNWKRNDIIVGTIRNADLGLLRKAADIIKEKAPKCIYALVSECEDRFSMVVGIGPECKKDKFNAVELLNNIGADFHIRGGGRPDFAQAGGRCRAGVEVARILKKAEEVISST